GACESYSSYNSAQLSHVYSDDWYLTGFSVREDYGSDLGIIIEDPAYDTDTTDAQLLVLANNLSTTFAYSADMTVQDIYDTIDRDVQPTALDEDGVSHTNAFQVEVSSYTTLDNLLAATATSSDLQESVTLAALETYLSNTAQANTYYSLVLARNDVARTVSMEDVNSYMAVTTSSGDMDIVIDFSGATTNSSSSSLAAAQQMTTHTISMSHYEYLGKVADSVDWASVSLEDFLDWLEDNSDVDSMTADDFAELNIAYTDENKNTMFNLVMLFYASLYYGASNVVALDNDALYDNDVSTDLIFYAQIARKVAYAVTYAYVGLTTGYILDFAQETIKNYAELSLAYKTGYISMAIVGAALMAFALYMQMSRSSDGESGNNFSLSVKVPVGIALGGALLYFKVLKPAYTVMKIVKKVFIEGQTLVSAAEKYLKGYSVSLKANVVATVILAIALITAFIVSVLSSGIAYGSIAYDTLLAYTIASLIVAIVMTALSLIPIVGQIITGIIMLIDMIVWLITGTTATEQVTQYLAEALYSVNVMTEFDDAAYSDMDIDLVNEEDGYIDGNAIQITQSITSTVRHVDPDVNFNFAFFAAAGPFIGITAAAAAADYAIRLAVIESFYTRDNIRNVAMEYELSNSEEMDKVSKGYNDDEWTVTDNSAGYKYQATKTDTVVNTFDLKTGINFHPAAYLNYAYAVPTVACWTFAADCDVEWSKDAVNGSDYGEGLSYDTIPCHAG
ncbi:MAG: hypothetical protein HC876_23625, partial [Chloroflexaceae bacterium]|nr:hypothetical protein [Chloroflexaceae bacterium]